jgi:hypothetical protein
VHETTIQINVVLVTLAALALAALAFVTHNFATDARAQVMQQAELMMESAGSVRR